MNKKIIIKVFLLVSSLVLFIQTMTLVESFYEWSVWRIYDGAPITIEGNIVKLKERRNIKEPPYQDLWIEGDVVSVRLDGAFTGVELREVRKINESLEIKYYPIVTGKKYIFYLRGLDSGKEYYSGNFRDDIWQGPVVFLLILFASGLMIFALSFVFGYVFPDSNK